MRLVQVEQLGLALNGCAENLHLGRDNAGGPVVGDRIGEHIDHAPIGPRGLAPDTANGLHIVRAGEWRRHDNHRSRGIASTVIQVNACSAGLYRSNQDTRLAAIEALHCLCGRFVGVAVNLSYVFYPAPSQRLSQQLCRALRSPHDFLSGFARDGLNLPGGLRRIDAVGIDYHAPTLAELL